MNRIHKNLATKVLVPLWLVTIAQLGGACMSCAVVLTFTQIASTTYTVPLFTVGGVIVFAVLAAITFFAAREQPLDKTNN